MPKRKDLKKILVVGAGPIIIGQACEFDYSGTQACKALKDEGYKVVLINSNPATIMTDPDVADKTYIEPITLEVLEKILKKEKPDAILPTMGGQTALNLAMEAEKKGVLKKYKIFSSSKNLQSFKNNIKKLSLTTPVKKIFEAINSHSSKSEIRYVGGCLRKILNNEKVDDIDLATNLNPLEVSETLKKNNINFYESGIEHGTITAIIDNHKFEITSLREDIFTDGRHARVKFSKDWKKDAARRDFTINSIYADLDGNLFDPYNGKKDIEKGQVSFIGDPEKRIKEDYLRILRYLRFFLNYSKQPHEEGIIKIIKINIKGISIISKERLLDELKKLLRSNQLEKLSKDIFSIDLILLIFPELKNIKRVLYAIKDKNKAFINLDFMFILFSMIIDETDNLEYFLYKYNISKKDQKRAYAINGFYNDKSGSKTLNE
ncbi:hypothetical protein OA862_02095, partial [Candidatus Pelagibacter sp.]|nr:hypothetical protein [Candidatus Pelagibacter sp.]